MTKIYVVAGQYFTSKLEAVADCEAMRNEGYNVVVEEYGMIDGEVYSIQEYEKELQFQSDIKLANERNALIDFVG